MLYVISRRLISKVRERTISRADILMIIQSIRVRALLSIIYDFIPARLALATRVHRRNPEGDEKRDYSAPAV